jgi:hypothetical protein
MKSLLHRIAVACLPALFFSPTPHAVAADAATASCDARSSALPPALVELYTSEGCSSCPPADRWLSSLRGRDEQVIALAFHVDYWDQLGWPDRFATRATTERQHRLQQASGARYVYTPQVIVNGRDRRDWAAAALPRLPASPIALSLQRAGGRVVARVETPSDGPLAGYWAVLEDGHTSRVRAGENAGATLAHDHVVVLYRPLAAWSGKGQHRFELDLAPAGTERRRVVFVVTDAAGTRPLQALALGC